MLYLFAFIGLYFLIGCVVAAVAIWKDESGMGLFGLMFIPIWPIVFYKGD